MVTQKTEVIGKKSFLIITFLLQISPGLYQNQTRGSGVGGQRLTG